MVVKCQLSERFCICVCFHMHDENFHHHIITLIIITKFIIITRGSLIVKFRGLGSARAASLPPDGLLCNYTTHLCHGQRLQGYEFCIRLILMIIRLFWWVTILILGTFLKTKLLPTSHVPTLEREVNRWEFLVHINFFWVWSRPGPQLATLQLLSVKSLALRDLSA